MRYADKVTMKKKRNYDKKVKFTRILLSDYLVLKGFAQRAGISMAQALHRLIEHQAQLPLPAKTMPAFRVTAPLAFRVTAPLALQMRSEPTMVTNGHKVGVLVINAKGGVISE